MRKARTPGHVMQRILDELYCGFGTWTLRQLEAETGIAYNVLQKSMTFLRKRKLVAVGKGSDGWQLYFTLTAETRASMARERKKSA